MTLNNIRKFAIRSQTRIRFRLRNGMEAVIDEHGLARVPSLNRPPDFHIEDELGHVTEFQLEALQQAGKPQARTCARQELEQLTTSAPEPHHVDE